VALVEHLGHGSKHAGGHSGLVKGPCLVLVIE
jgi:hypothetical protein